MAIRTVAAGILAVAVGAGAAFAEAPMLTGDVLRTAVSGKTVYISTPVGSVPIVYRPNGTMQGRSRILAGYSGPETDRGTWWIAKDRLCQRWDVWLDGRQHCYRMQREGNTVHWSRDDGRTGTATIAH